MLILGFGIDGVDLILSMYSPNNNVILCEVGLWLDVNMERRFVTTRKKLQLIPKSPGIWIYPIVVGETICIFLISFGLGLEFTQSIHWMQTFFPKDKMAGT